MELKDDTSLCKCRNARAEAELASKKKTKKVSKREEGGLLTSGFMNLEVSSLSFWTFIEENLMLFLKLN